MAKIKYKQCELEKPLGKWLQKQTAWIPEHLAHVGKVLRVHLQREVWENGWKVTAVGKAMDEDYVLEHERDWREFPTADQKK